VKIYNRLKEYKDKEIQDLKSKNIEIEEKLKRKRYEEAIDLTQG